MDELVFSVTGVCFESPWGVGERLGESIPAQSCHNGLLASGYISEECGVGGLSVLFLDQGQLNDQFPSRCLTKIAIPSPGGIPGFDFLHPRIVVRRRGEILHP
ncbi:hypothetical protein CVV68_21915 [Arthrobacter livingstonensis]|uniref:Uncharacterized protein n=1 Tax=Arthrobacter livingstonensis TaxID=670078 RepID=A0A2V5L2U0_9MICC|nr:hypothetical protein CVV68_21915 [Arthrobacter livingstonensis]